MTNETKAVTLFNFEDNEFRILTDERDGYPWFVLKEVLAAMGSTTHPAVAKASIEEVFGKEVCNVYPLQTAGGKKLMTIINEPAVTFLASRSNTGTGDKLNRWIQSGFLPYIRKTGSYAVPQDKEITPDSSIDAPIFVGQSKAVSSEPCFALVTILDRLGLGRHAIAAQKLLLIEGYLEKTERNAFPIVTKKGLKYGKNAVCEYFPNETQPLWYKSTITDLLEELGLLFY